MLRNITLVTIIAVFSITLAQSGPSKRTWSIGTEAPVDEVPESVNKSLTSHSFLSMVFPLIAKGLIAPFKSLAQILSQFFLFIAVAAYLLSSLVPGMVGGTSKRSLGIPEFLMSPFLNTFSTIWNLDLRSYINAGLDLFSLRSEECRSVLACKLGTMMGRDQPLISKYMVSIANGINMLMDNDTQIMVESMKDAMEGSDNCQELLPRCSSIEKAERLWNAFMAEDDHQALFSRMVGVMGPNETAETSNAVYKIFRRFVC